MAQVLDNLKYKVAELHLALHELQINPLVRFFQLEHSGNHQQKPWWRRAWFVVGLGYTLLLTAVLLYLAWENFTAAAAVDGTDGWTYPLPGALG